MLLAAVVAAPALAQVPEEFSKRRVQSSLATPKA